MRKRISKQNNMPKLIFLCLITTIIVTTLTLSKYESTLAGNSNAIVAVPVMDLSTNTISLNINPIDEEKIYTFSVANIKDKQQSEVSMKYTIQIQSLENLPLEFELYAETDTRREKNLLSGNGKITDPIVMGLEEEKHTYNLKIKWRELEDSYLYSQTIDYVQIVLNSEQID